MLTVLLGFMIVVAFGWRLILAQQRRQRDEDESRSIWTEIEKTENPSTALFTLLTNKIEEGNVYAAERALMLVVNGTMPRQQLHSLTKQEGLFRRAVKRIESRETALWRMWRQMTQDTAHPNRPHFSIGFIKALLAFHEGRLDFAGLVGADNEKSTDTEAVATI